MSAASEGVVFRALADPTRRWILDLLRQSGPLRAGEIAGQVTDMTRIAVSKHLRVLREARLIRPVDSDDGRERKYALDSAGMEAVRRWLQTYDAFWQERLDKLKELAESGADSTTN